MPTFVLDPCVEDELGGIWHFIAQDNPYAATHVIEAAYETLKRLRQIPALAGRAGFAAPGYVMFGEE